MKRVTANIMPLIQEPEVVEEEDARTKKKGRKTDAFKKWETTFHERCYLYMYR